MKLLTRTTALALVLSMSSQAFAAGLNTVPLNGLGQPVPTTPVTTAAGLLRNTTISSSLNVPKTAVTTAAGLQPNTTISSSLNVPKTVVTTAAGLQPNTTISSSLNVPKTVVTTAAGLQPNTTIASSLNVPKTPVITAAAGLPNKLGTIAVPNVAASTPKGTLTPPPSSSYYALYGDTSTSDSPKVPPINPVSNMGNGQPGDNGDGAPTNAQGSGCEACKGGGGVGGAWGVQDPNAMPANTVTLPSQSALTSTLPNTSVNSLTTMGGLSGSTFYTGSSTPSNVMGSATFTMFGITLTGMAAYAANALGLFAR
jgi:hypothetical protein